MGRVLLIGLCPERKIYVQVIYLGHAPTKGDGEAGRDAKSPSKIVSQADPPGHLGPNSHK